MARVLSLFSHLMPLWVVLLGMVGYLHPALLTPLLPIVPWFFMVTMVGVGALLDVREFLPVLKQPQVVLLGTATQFTVMPLAGYVIARVFRLPPDLAFGFVLVGAVPGAMASNVITYLAGADVAYSISITAVSTALAPLLTPTATYVFAHQWLSVDFFTMMLTVAKLVVGPLAAGMALRGALARYVGVLRAACPAFSTVCIALICAVFVAKNRERLAAFSGVLAAGVILHNALGFAGGWGSGFVFRLSPRRRRTLSIEVGMQNAGLGATVAAGLVSAGAAAPGIALPSALFASWCVVTASALAVFWRLRPNRG